MDEGGGGLHSPPLARVQEMFLLRAAALLGDSPSSIVSQYLREWPEVYSPCFWTSTFVLIQLAFISSIAAQYLFKRIRWCRQRLKTATPESNKHSNQEQQNADIKLGVSYQASKVCCLLILATHVLRIFFLQLQGRISGCRGKTGIISINSGITEPLLSPSAGQQTETKRTCLYGRASVLDLVTFSWMGPLFATGYKKPLDKNDVPDIDERDYADLLSDSFKRILADVERRHGLSTLSIYRAMFLFIRRKAIINAVFAILCACASYVGPSLINDLVRFLGRERKYGLKKGYILAAAFLSAKVVETVAQRQWIFGARRLGMRLRAALISHIYQKGLRLSCSARQKHTSGEIINYMSVDIQRITDVIWYTNYIWMLPIQLSLAVYVLYLNLGAGAWAGLAATLVIMACNIPLTRLQKRLQSEIMAAKDNRMKATTEVLRSMKILKLQAWDTEYLQKLEALRREEHNWLWKSVRLTAFTTFIFWGSPAFISSITFGTCILMGIPLTAGTVLSALATFRMLQDPIFTLPDLLSVFAQGKVSADRVAQYLQEEELKDDAITEVPRSATDYDVEIDHGAFSWELETTSPTITDVNLKVKRGMKVAICGMVGSGKSSLLSCILGEMPKLAGAVRVSGSRAYVPQTAWILSGNIRDNILFGNPYDKEKYEKIIQACALTKDLELFANGDLTEIGERGINMSGGQKQRIQIARSVYEDADIYLFDDPFSAVDAHTGAQLFKDCLMGMLKDKTILYVTHQVEFLPAADLILVMQDGKIVQKGRFDDLLKQNIGFEAIVGAHSQAIDSVINAESSSRILSTESQKLADSDDEFERENDTDDQVQGIIKQESEHDVSQGLNEKGRLTQEEEREKGGIGKTVYWAYLTAIHGGALAPVIVAAQSFFQIFQVASNYWMAWACPPISATTPRVGLGLLLSVYLVLSIGSALCVFGRSMLVSLVGLLTAEKFFKNMLHCILRAPMSFFDSTPTGRILNRVSSDQSVLDLEIASKLGWCAFSVIQILGTIGVMSQVAWPVFAIFIPVTAICYVFQRYYIPTARELARLSQIQRAPILHHFAESLTGAASIRAYGQKDRFRKANISLVNNHSRPWFHNISAIEWLCFRLNMLSNFVFAFSLTLLSILRSLIFGGCKTDIIVCTGIAGLAVTYALNLNGQLSSITWNICNTENKMISVERIMQYSRIPSEAPLIVDDHRPPNSWPKDGTINIRNLEVRYAEHLPSVLRNISCTIPGRKKVGIVGRTGSGKSTLIQALFRIVEPRVGTIEIDDVDLSKIGLHDLRGRLSIIPQDPTMFEGTVRGNLDPLNEYSDQHIWETLDKCQLGDIVRQSPKKLDSTVVENGENWSVGQRQLFCLGRVLLKRSNVLVLDEATASVDSSTDAIIQQTLREEFGDCTVLTVAHRIHTVIDSDLILVFSEDDKRAQNPPRKRRWNLQWDGASHRIHTVIDSDLILVFSEGRIIEYDTPSRLLEDENSEFSRLIKEYSRRSKGF
ncbi:ABC transporter C family member 9 [Triticum urartu]|uniref:ABC transporter C family member 13 n=1 Tax=Triticum urartu TaxID=4572 RepID=M8AIG0_TRIUA|nr:ABC transporter C family member 9 [Triticum urartu]